MKKLNKSIFDIFNKEDKRALLNRIPFVTDLGRINVEVSDMNKSIEAELKYALGWDGSKVFYDPSVKYALNAARQKLQARYEHYKEKSTCYHHFLYIFLSSSIHFPVIILEETFR